MSLMGGVGYLYRFLIIAFLSIFQGTEGRKDEEQPMIRLNSFVTITDIITDIQKKKKKLQQRTVFGGRVGSGWGA